MRGVEAEGVWCSFAVMSGLCAERGGGWDLECEIGGAGTRPLAHVCAENPDQRRLTRPEMKAFEWTTHGH